MRMRRHQSQRTAHHEVFDYPWGCLCALICVFQISNLPLRFLLPQEGFGLWLDDLSLRSFGRGILRNLPLTGAHLFNDGLRLLCDLNDGRSGHLLPLPMQGSVHLVLQEPLRTCECSCVNDCSALLKVSL